MKVTDENGKVYNFVPVEQEDNQLPKYQNPPPPPERKSQLPTELLSWYELLGDYEVEKFKYSDSHKEGVNNMSDTFNKLLHHRDIYNDGEMADWEDGQQIKWCIIPCKDIFSIEGLSAHAHPFNFKSKELAEKFLKHFEKELKIVKPLMS